MSLSAAFDAAGVLWCERAPVGGEHRRVTSISTDTRELERGALFVGLEGPNFDGASFAQRAVEAGATSVLARDGDATRAALARLAAEHGVAVGTVPSGRAALAGIARLVRSRIQAPVVGITGSVGKTSTKDALRTLGEAAGVRVAASRASFNNDVGVPRTLFAVDPRDELVVVEIGTNAPGEIASLAGVASPTVAVLTRVGRSHLEGLGSLKGVAQEKGALFESLAGVPGAVCVLGHDTPLRERIVARVPHGARLVTVSVDGDPTASLIARNVRSDGDGTRFEVGGDAAGALSGHELRVPLLGRHAVLNVLLALAALDAAGFAPEASLDGLERLEPAAHRLAARRVGGVTVIDDAYNANPDSFRAAVRVLADQDGPRTLVAGPMGELGDDAERLHAELGLDVVAAGIERAVLVDPDGAPVDVRLDALERALGATVEVVRAASVDEAADAAAAARRGTILVKASRAARLERVVDGLHERFAQVHGASAAHAGAGGAGA
ncbi:MAG: UDP-N-acetylmuramoyl-tripeptide--D-alanyl-D-alanine ligase [Planctomycetota bacterium]